LGKSNHSVLIFALGGLGEIGKNMYVIQCDDDIVVVDAGLKFPEEEMLGIDMVIPDITYLEENREKVRGIIITHGHEDHIGGLPYVLRHLDVPIYATKLTLGLIEAKLKENGMLGETRRHLITGDSEIRLGKLKVSFFRTNHSIPDSVGVCIDTPQGAIVHTGDFKFDQTPVNNQTADIAKMAQIGAKGVLCLLSDSTNAERPGFTGSERSVGEAIKHVFSKASGRIIVSTFASNVHRVQQVFDAAYEYNRKVAIVGRSMLNVITISMELGYLNAPEGLIVEPDDVNRLPADKVVILSTGSQGEPMSALTRMARSAHRKLDILPGDTVVIAATPIPGNEKYVARTIDQLYRIGAEVIYGGQGSTGAVHVSGHGSQEDLRLMLNLMKPKFFIPIHGEYRMLLSHRDLALQTGIPEDRIFIMNIGDTLSVYRNRAKRGRTIPSGQVLISNGEMRPTHEDTLLLERMELAQEGIVIVVMTVDRKTRQILAGPDIVSRGFVYMQDARPLLRRAEALLKRNLNRLGEKEPYDHNAWLRATQQQLRRYFAKEVGRTPHIMPSILEV